MAEYNAMYTTIWMPKSIPADIVRDAMAAPPDVRSVTAPIAYQGQEFVQRDIANFKTALDGLSFVEAFMPSATPSRADVDADQIYSSESAYLYALADAMHEEYKAIVDAGFRYFRIILIRAGRNCGAPLRCRSKLTTTR
jgi:5-methyltetrahydropteroyltriglutamate--homocysteine methyltransferase